MRIAILADIHGNLGALEAVLAHIETQNVEQTIVAGDVVNVMPHSKACWDTVTALGCPVLKGNHEHYLTSYGTAAAHPDWATERFQGLAWAQGQLTEADLNAMRQLPLTYQLSGLLVTHAAPHDIFAGVHADTPTETLRELFRDTSEAMIVRGHNHGWLKRRWDDRTLVTIQSCGLPLGGSLDAQYVILTRQAGGWRYEKQFVPYDREATLAAMDERYLEVMGPTGQLFKRELATGKNHIMPFLREYLAVVDGQLPLSEAVTTFLAREAGD